MTLGLLLVILTTYIDRLSLFSLAPCQDAVPQFLCAYYKGQSLCSKTNAYVFANCKKTCNFCSAGKLHVLFFCLIIEEKSYITYRTYIT